MNLKRAESDVEQAGKQVEAKQNKIGEYQKQITNLPPGVTLETINEDVNS